MDKKIAEIPSSLFLFSNIFQKNNCLANFLVNLRSNNFK